MMVKTEKAVITNEQKANNQDVIAKCAVGLHFCYLELYHKTGGFGYASLVYNGKTVSFDEDDEQQSLSDLDQQGFVLTLCDDEEIPPAFQPKDLVELSIYKQWVTQ